ncbi:MAG: flavin reductase family protein [Gemmatimonadales bacterium]
MDPFEFRQLCGRFATGVTVVTALDTAGVPVGMTANSLASISLDPPLVSIAIELSASVHEVLLSAPRFAINILESHQEALSRRFASGLADRFEGVGWHRGPDDQVLLDGALAHLICERWTTLPAGDHTVLIGTVVGGSAADHGRPLLYYRGGYADLEPM